MPDVVWTFTGSHYAGRALPVTIRFDLAFVNDRLECTELVIKPRPRSRGLTTQDLRAINLSGLVEQQRRLAYKTVREMAEGKGFPPDWSRSKAARIRRAYETALPAYERAAAAAGTQRGRRGDSVDYDGAEIARVYREALLEGRAPRLAVGEHFHVERSGASKLIRWARDVGALGETKPGIAGERRKRGRK